MFVVGKLNRELSFIFWFCGLACAIRFAERETPVFVRRGVHVADRADSRTCADEGLSCEKLLAMTTDTGIMTWKVSDVRKVTFCGPHRRDFVTGIARQAFVFVRRMLECGVFRW